MKIKQEEFHKYFSLFFKEYYKVLYAKISEHEATTIYKIIASKSKKQILDAFLKWEIKNDKKTIDVQKINDFVPKYIANIVKTDEYADFLYMQKSKDLKKGIIVALTKKVYNCDERNLINCLIEIFRSVYGESSNVDINRKVKAMSTWIEIKGMNIDLFEIEIEIRKYYSQKITMDKRFNKCTKRDFFKIKPYTVTKKHHKEVLKND